MAKTREYMDYLDERIGIAPANSQEEYQAAETIADVMGDHGLEPAIEEFDARPMAAVLPSVLDIATFVSLVVCGLTQGAVHVLFLLLAIACVAVRLVCHFGPNLLENVGPTATSQNVVAVHYAEGDKVVKGARPIVVVAHYDAPRESLWRRGVLATAQAPLKRAAIPCAIVVAASLLFQIMGFLPQILRTIVWVVGIMAALPLLFLAVVSIVDRHLPCTVGANDNKSGVAALLAIMDKVQPGPDRVSGDDDQQDRPVRRRRSDAPAQPAQPRMVEVFEEVKGVRHGAEVLGSLGILPPSCELLYEEPKVHLVEEGSPEVVDAFAPEPEPEPAVKVQANEAPQAEPAEDESPAAAPVSDVVVEDEPELAEPEDLDAPMQQDESPEDVAVDYDGSRTRARRRTVDLVDDEDDELFEDYDDEEMEESYDEFDDYEGGSGLGALSSVGSWFSSKFAALRERFGGQDDNVSIEPGRDRRTRKDEALWDEDEDFLDDEDLYESMEDDYEDDEAELFEDEELDPASGLSRLPVIDAEADDYDESDEFEDEAYDGELYDEDDLSWDDEDEEATEEVEPYEPDEAYDEGEPYEAYDEGEPYSEDKTYEDEQPVADGELDYADSDGEDSTAEMPVAHVYAEDVYDDDFEEDESAYEDEWQGEASEELEEELDEEDSEDYGDLEEEWESWSEEEEIDDEYEAAAAYGGGVPLLGRIRGVLRRRGTSDEENEDFEAYEEEAYQAEDEEDFVVEDDEDVKTAEDFDDAKEEALWDEEDVEEELEVYNGEPIDYADFPYWGEDDSDEPEAAPYGYLEEEEDDEEPYEEYEAWSEEDALQEDDLDVYDAEVAAGELVEDDYEDEYEVESEDYDDSYYEDDEAYDYVEEDFVEDEVELEAPVAYAPLHDPNELHFDRDEDEDIIPRDTTGLDTLSDGYDPITEDDVVPEVVEEPEPVDDPNWGVSSYQPARPAMNIARRAALFDLPDPTSISMDPFANEGEYEDDEPYDEHGREVVSVASESVVDDGYDDTDDYDEYYLEDDFDAEDDRPTFGWKGGATVRADLLEGDEPLVIDEDDLQEAILEFGDEFLIAHDIWFVAAGASSVDHAGIKAFIAEHRRDIRGSFLINLDSVGAGDLGMYVQEGVREPRRADRRLVRLIKDVAADLHIKLETAAYSWGETDAATPMRSRVRAVSIVGLDNYNMPALSRSADDVPDNVNPKQVSDVVKLVTELIRRS